MSKPAAPQNVAQERDDLSFFAHQNHTDVEFIVENGADERKSIKAHKMVLAMRNEIFETMFYGNLPEGDKVSIKDSDPASFCTFLRYLYSQKVAFTDIQQALGVRSVAQKYMESKLVEECDWFIQNSMLPNNVCEVLDYAMQHGELSNFDNSINYLLEISGRQVLESKAFIAASKETVIKILKNPQLRVREFDVIKSVYEWAIARCAEGTGQTSIAALQKTMRPFLAELRFLTLSPQEFVEGPCAWNILTESETLAVLSYIIKRDSKKLPGGFSTSTVNRDGPHGPNGFVQI